MGVGSEIAQSISESLLGKNSAGFSRAMNDRKKQQGSGRNTGGNSQMFMDNTITGANGSGQSVQQARKGGKVIKSGRVKLHRGEVVRSKNRRGRSR